MKFLKNQNQNGIAEMILGYVSIVFNYGFDKKSWHFDNIRDKNFQSWVFKKQEGAASKFTEEQMQWLRMIKDYIAGSFHLEKEDFELDPFNKVGGLGKMWEVFGEGTEEIINELNEVLAA